MAHFPFNGYINIGGQDQSAHCFQLTANRTQAEIDDTVFGDTFKNRIVGLQDLELTLQFRNDVTDDDLDEDLEALFGVGVSSAIKYRYKQGGVGPSNPEYQFTGQLTSMTDGAAVGDGAGKQVTLKMAAGTLVRAIA